MVAQAGEVNYDSPKDSINPKYTTPRFFNMLGTTIFGGKYRMGFGLNYTGFHYHPNRKVFTGINFGYEHLITHTGKQNELSGLSLRSGQFGIQVFPRISKNLFIKIGVLFQAGRDHHKYTVTNIWSYTGQKEIIDKYWVFGIAPSQGITFIPTTRSGLSISLSFYQRFFNVEHYKYDLGGMLSLAIRF